MSAASNAGKVYTIDPSTDHTASVIFLHGLGDTGSSWRRILEIVKEPYIKYICPTATVNPVSLNRGKHMPSWFDVFGLDENSEQDEKSITEAAELLQSYIADEERNGIPRDRIVIGGISQGGATVLYSAFTIPQPPVAGIAVISTWLPLHRTFPERAKANLETPVFQGHGECDALVQHKFGSAVAEIIRSFNNRLQFKSYPDVPHWFSRAELMDVKEFIAQCLPPIAEKSPTE